MGFVTDSLPKKLNDWPATLNKVVAQPEPYDTNYPSPLLGYADARTCQTIKILTLIFLFNIIFLMVDAKGL